MGPPVWQMPVPPPRPLADPTLLAARAASFAILQERQRADFGIPKPPPLPPVQRPLTIPPELLGTNTQNAAPASAFSWPPKTAPVVFGVVHAAADKTIVEKNRGTSNATTDLGPPGLADFFAEWNKLSPEAKEAVRALNEFWIATPRAQLPQVMFALCKATNFLEAWPDPQVRLTYLRNISRLSGLTTDQQRELTVASGNLARLMHQHPVLS